MQSFLHVVNRFFDLVFVPFCNLHPFYVLVFFSLLTGLISVAAFRFTSDQKAIRRVKDRIQAHVLAIRLFQDQLGAVARSYGSIVADAARYIRYSLPALGLIAVPVILIITQLDMRLSWLPLQPRQDFLVTARMTNGVALEAVSLQLPAALKLSGYPVRVPERNEITWRLRATDSGEFSMAVVAGGQTFTKRVRVARSLAQVSPARVRGSALLALLSPGEPPLPPGAPVEAIEVKYGARNLELGEYRVDWLVLFFALSLVAAFAIKPVMKAEL